MLPFLLSTCFSCPASAKAGAWMRGGGSVWFSAAGPGRLQCHVLPECRRQWPEPRSNRDGARLSCCLDRTVRHRLWSAERVAASIVQVAPVSEACGGTFTSWRFPSGSLDVCEASLPPSFPRALPLTANMSELRSRCSLGRPSTRICFCPVWILGETCSCRRLL